MIVPTVALRRKLLGVDDRAILFDLFGGSRSGAELVHKVDRLAGAIREASGPYPRVGLWFRNSFAAVEAFLAVEWVSGTRVPVDPTASAAEAREVFEAARADIVLTDAAHGAAFGERALVHDDRQPLAGAPFEPIPTVDPDRTFMVYPRSVTRGNLFGVPLSYRNWNKIIETNIALYRSGRYGVWEESSEVFLAAQQIMHGTGFLGTFPFLAMGLPQVIVDNFDITRVVDAIQRHRVTATMFVPGMLQSLLEKVDEEPRSVSSLRHLLYGGAPMPRDQLARAIERLGSVLTQVYGRVEGGWPIAILDARAHTAPRDRNKALLGSCGQPIGEVATRLRPLSDRPDDVGELLIKCGMTSADYADADGWCSLGDIMRRDADGYLYFEQRLDRMINTGYHIYPDEIEAILASAHGVSGVTVVGESHPRWGQMVVAYVVPTGEVPGPNLIDSLKLLVGQRLAKYKIPREFRIVETLP